MRVSHTIHMHHLCRQVPGEEVQIWGKLYWVNDTATTFQHNWHIHMTAVSGGGCWGGGGGEPGGPCEYMSRYDQHSSFLAW